MRRSRFPLLVLVLAVCSACSAMPGTTRTKAASPLRKVRSGMGFTDVVKLAGPPTSQSRQVTAQAFNPFHIGGEGQITEFHYARVGRVYFTGPDFEGGNASVIAVQEDPNEPGE